MTPEIDLTLASFHRLLVSREHMAGMVEPDKTGECLNHSINYLLLHTNCHWFVSLVRPYHLSLSFCSSAGRHRLARSSAPTAGQAGTASVASMAVSLGARLRECVSRTPWLSAESCPCNHRTAVCWQLAGGSSPPSSSPPPFFGRWPFTGL